VWGRDAVLQKINNQILRDIRSIKDEQDRLRLEAQLRGQPVLHVVSDDVYQWYRRQGATAAIEAMERVIRINNAGRKKGGKK
jgi:hypothetical protein